MGKFSAISSTSCLCLCLWVATVQGGVINNAIDSQEEDPALKEIMSWEAPYYIKKNFPFALTGFDEEGCPVWVIEYGRWDVRALMENGTQAVEDFRKYVIQALTMLHMSPKKYSTPDKLVEEFVVVGDLDGFNYRQFSHVPTVTRALQIFQDYVNIENKYGRRLKAIWGVNVNYLANSIWQIAKPLIGDLANVFRVHGTNDKWKIELLKEVPRSALPEFLGGFKNHTVLEVYG